MGNHMRKQNLSMIVEGTILRHEDTEYIVAQVRAGLFQLISRHGNRWQDYQCPRNTLIPYIQAQGFKVVRQGGF